MIDRKPVTQRTRGPLSIAAASLLALATLAPASAFAQAQTFYLDRLYMAGAPDDAIGLWRPHMGKKTRFYGQVGLGFALNPLRVENHIDDERAAALLDQAGGAAVGPQLTGYVDVGVELLDRFAVQLEFPVIAAQDGNPTRTGTVGSDAVNLQVAAPMDLRLDLRGILYRNESRSFKFGALGAVWLPTGNEDSFAGDGSTSAAIGVAAEYDFQSFFLLLNTGVHFRPGGALNDFAVSHEWRWGVGGFVPLREGTIRLGAQIFGSTGIGEGQLNDTTKVNTTFDTDNTPLEWMVEGRLATDAKKHGYVGLGAGTRMTAGYAPDFRAVAVAGGSFGIEDTHPPSPPKRFVAARYAEHGADTDKDGLPDDIDLCPVDPEDKKPPNTDDGCPAPPDRDGDGIPDSRDKCPDVPEDLDKVDDQDGCPENDPDKDGIADAKDACPKEPGEPSAVPAKNGCPQFIRRITGGTEIQILKQVEFATGKATILPGSYSILDEVVRLMKVNPDIKQLAIEGHTDNRGSDELNEKLSNDRSISVMKYLVDHGIEASRLTAKGFGPKRPIADNNTVAGRQKNRRVEFHIRERSANP